MPLLTEAAICNLALLRVGQRQTIDSLEEDTTEAMVCKAIYAHTRDRLIEAAWWQFATKRATLALTSEERSGWAYIYALPSDCVVARYIWAGARSRAKDELIPFSLELSDAGTSRVLCTDEAEAELIYTADIGTPALFSSKFQDALAWSLAAELTLSLTVKPQLASQALQMAAISLRDAIASDRAQAEPDTQPDAEHLRARG